jgi:hypothetical protein
MNCAGRQAGATIYFVVVVAPFPLASTETKWLAAFIQCWLSVLLGGSD